MPSPLSRRAFLASLGLAGAAWTGYAHQLEPQWLEIARHDVKTNSPGAPIRILHMADLHASWCVSLSFIEEAIRLGTSLKPDLICLTGDFITSKYKDFDAYSRVLSQLRAAAPVFACLGNHDGGMWSFYHGGYKDTQHVRALLEKSGIELLHNREMVVNVQGRPVSLVGLGDCYAMEAEPERAFASPAPPGATRVVLSHNPDTKVMLEPYAWDLVLCGHTHGGQLWIPGIGAPLAPVEDKRFIAGLYQWHGRWLHITKGVGNIMGLRFNCRPDIALLTLV